jgi:hypothetical protein
MKKLNNEKNILVSDNDLITLTDHRIYLDEKMWGYNYYIEIYLENISSIEAKYASKPLFLILSILFLISFIFLGISENESSAMGIGLVLGLVFFLLWWRSRKHVLSISSNGGSKLNFSVEGFSDEKIEDFVWKLSQAKADRVLTMNN